MSKIHAAERPIGEVFSDAYRFSIPLYQRPYAWTTEQAGEMFDDLHAASARGADSEADPYFLGSVVLVKTEGDPAAEVVDGQQRLTTLTILMAVLRDRIGGDIGAALDKRLFQKGDPITGTVDRPRLRLRELDQDFFETHVQSDGATTSLADLNAEQLSDSRRNIHANATLFHRSLAELDDDDCRRLIQFVDQQTYLVIVATQDFESAYRIFTVLNERGLELSHTDILKSEIIGEISPSEQELYTKKWEDEEDDLGREDFADLFGHIRMVFARTKARESILKEFRASVVSRFPDRRQLIDEVIVPLSDAYETVTRSNYQAPAGAEDVNTLLGWLNQLDNQDWIAPAIEALRADPPAEDYRQFLADLERLAASMLIRRTDVTRRIERYGRVLAALTAGEDLYLADSPLQLTTEEQAETVSGLGGEVYRSARVRRYALLRLDSAMSSGGASYDHSVITIEHVLPQSPKPDSQWCEWFTDSQREYWVHRLANLVLLTRRKNSEAQNYEFDVKKEKYFTTKSGTSPFVLTTQVLTRQDWTPEYLDQRQAASVAALASLWRLGSETN